MPPDSTGDEPSGPPAGTPPVRRPGAGLLQRMGKGGITHVVAIGSGKGGVGKSSVTAMLASELHRRGLRVGILDADVTGPSIPKLLGLSGGLVDRGEGIEPAQTADGLTVVSSQFMVEDEKTPVIWRGPLVTRLILQFFGGVSWGKLDYLLIDMPPGTSDVPLTVFQAIPLDGMVFVFTPQELAALIVRKAMNMARELHVPLLGVVENLSYLDCPHCHTRLEPFGPSAVAVVASEYGVPLLARLPIDPKVSTLGDAGEIGTFTSPEIQAMTTAFLASVEAAKAESPTVL
jgi:ATP-binding protein involved in chromosome partitioning